MKRCDIGRWPSEGRLQWPWAWWNDHAHPHSGGHTPSSFFVHKLTPAALVTAPFFVHIEMLFGFFGWNPALEKRISNLSAKRIVTMNKARRARGKKAE